MHVYHGQLVPPDRLEEIFVSVIEAVEGGEEVDGRGGEVHDEMGHGLGHGHDSAKVVVGIRTAESFDGEVDHMLAFVMEVKDVVDGVVDECVSVFAVRADEAFDLMEVSDEITMYLDVCGSARGGIENFSL